MTLLPDDDARFFKMNISPFNFSCLVTGVHNLTEITTRADAFTRSADGVLNEVGADRWISENYDNMCALLHTVDAMLALIDDALISGQILFTDDREGK